jgi:hypothetical protein
MCWCSDVPEDEAISLFAGLLANPDMTLSLCMKNSKVGGHVGVEVLVLGR